MVSVNDTSPVEQRQLANIFWRKSLGPFAPLTSSALRRWDLNNYHLYVPGFWVAKVNGYDSFLP